MTKLNLSASYQDRVKVEKDELDAKHAKLVEFLATEQFSALPLEDQNLLHEQNVAMAEYSDILGKRITRFSPAEPKLST